MLKLFMVIKITSVLLIAGVVYLLFNIGTVWHYADKDDVKNSDAIVVLGAAQYDGKPTAVFRARLDTALELWKQKRSPYIVVSGGKQPGDRYTEATAGAMYLMARGVPDEKILREISATNTWQEMESISQILKRRGLSSVIIVSDGFHLARARAIGSNFGLEVRSAPAKNSPIKDGDAYRRYFTEGAALAVARVAGYDTVYKVEEKLQGRMLQSQGTVAIY